MEAKSRRQKQRGDALTSLNRAIDALDLARDSTNAKQAKGAFGCASALLTATRDTVIEEPNYVELGLACAGVCQDLDRGINGGGVDQLNQPILKEIERLATTMTGIKRHIAKRSKRNVISKFFHTKDDEQKIAPWKSDLDSIRQALDAELARHAEPKATDTLHDISNAQSTVSDPHRDVSNADTTVTKVHRDLSNTHPAVPGIGPGVVNTRPIAPEVRHDSADSRVAVSDIHRYTLNSRKGMDSENRTTHASAPDDSPSPPPASVPGTSSDIRRDVVRTQDIVSGVRRDIVELQHVLRSRECDGSRHPLPQPSILGESPPPPPRACFGRDELVERIVGLVEKFNPVAFIGPGGMGKTSIALTVLHHSRIKKQFGDNRRFIRCDQFTASRANLLSRLSKVTGAGIENPEDLTPLRPFLSSKEMFIVFDNAESILDPQGTDGQGIYRVVKEVSQFSNICVAITSRITTIPPDCKRLDIPPLSLAAARSAFHRIYDNNGRQDLIDKILEQLDFHPLSVTLLATIAHQNNWDNDRLAREWEQRQTRVLHTEQNESLAATIELSFTSPMFESLGPHARELLGVVAFFPQGVDENNLDQLFPTIPDAPTIFNKFCILSLTYQSGGFITMLTPLRDYLRPNDPNSSPLLCSAKEYYFTRMTAEVNPNKPGFRETQWIILEDANIEHLLSVYLSGDASSDDIWSACANFMKLLYWHKPQQTLLSSKIEALPDDHPSKPKCLFELSRLFGRVGNHVEQKRLLNHTLNLERERKDDRRVAFTLCDLSDANRMLGLYEEGISQAKEAVETHERFDDEEDQALCLNYLGRLLYDAKQLDAAEEVAIRSVELLPKTGQEFRLCQTHHLLGRTYRSRGKREHALHHLEVARKIASIFNWHHHLFWIHFSLAVLFLSEGKFDDAHSNADQVRSHALQVDDAYKVGRAALLQAEIWYRQGKLEEATSEAFRAVEVFEKLGAENMLEACRTLLQSIEKPAENKGTFTASDFSAWHVIQHLGESLEY